MMATLVSQCEKKVLNKTRRMLDAFAGHKALEFILDQVKAVALKTNGEDTAHV